MAKLVVIYWRDIPAQVNAQSGRTRHQVILEGRFQRAIDRAAMVADKKTAQEYVGEWRRHTSPATDDLEAEATAMAATLDAAFTKERLLKIVNDGGFDHDGSVFADSPID